MANWGHISEQPMAIYATILYFRNTFHWEPNGPNVQSVDAIDDFFLSFRLNQFQNNEKIINFFYDVLNSLAK